MPTLSPTEVLEALATRQVGTIIGTSEHDTVECKSAPYRLGEDRQRIELAKDVSGLANADGGLILIGVATQRREDTREDVVRAISPFDRTLLDSEQYQQ